MHIFSWWSLRLLNIMTTPSILILQLVHGKDPRLLLLVQRVQAHPFLKFLMLRINMFHNFFCLFYIRFFLLWKVLVVLYGHSRLYTLHTFRHSMLITVWFPRVWGRKTFQLIFYYRILLWSLCKLTRLMHSCTSF
jgi:hypothetical protein